MFILVCLNEVICLINLVGIHRDLFKQFLNCFQKRQLSHVRLAILFEHKNCLLFIFRPKQKRLNIQNEVDPTSNLPQTRRDHILRCTIERTIRFRTFVRKGIRKKNGFFFQDVNPNFFQCPKEYSMKYLLSNEYMRIWFQERAIYEKDTYSALETIANEKILRRKHVLRRNIKKDPLELPPIKIKKYAPFQK